MADTNTFSKQNCAKFWKKMFSKLNLQQWKPIVFYSLCSYKFHFHAIKRFVHNNKLQRCGFWHITWINMVISRNFIIVYYPFISAICDASMYVRIVDSKMQLNVIFISIFEFRLIFRIKSTEWYFSLKWPALKYYTTQYLVRWRNSQLQ